MEQSDASTRDLLSGRAVPAPVIRPARYNGPALMVLRDETGTALAVWDGNGTLHAIRDGLVWTVEDSHGSVLAAAIGLNSLADFYRSTEPDHA